MKVAQSFSTKTAFWSISGSETSARSASWVRRLSHDTRSIRRCLSRLLPTPSVSPILHRIHKRAADGRDSSRSNPARGETLCDALARRRKNRLRRRGGHALFPFEEK